MKKIPLSKKVLSVLESNLTESSSSFMTDAEIALVIYDGGYMPKTAYWLSKTIRNCMAQVKDLAEENGMIVIPWRSPTKSDPNKKFRILGWKIYEEGDEKYIIDELFFIKRKEGEHTEAFKTLKSNARKQGALGRKDLKALPE